MSKSHRRTTIVHGRLAMRELRLNAARQQQHGLQIMMFDQMVARLAGGFARPIDAESLRTAIKAILPTTPLGELDSIKLLPGMVDAVVDTLQKVWGAGINLAARADESPRLDSIARLEQAILAQLPSSLMRPVDLVAAAMLRLEHAEALLGSVEIVGMTELSPCWQPLLLALAQRIPVQWIAGPRAVPAWLDGAVCITRSQRMAPDITVVSASTSYHEAIEAIRWARSLLASGHAEPADIAITATMPAEYDHHFLSLRSDANLDLHFVHGINVTATREGQTAAALADILARGISQTRIRRLATLCGSETGPFKTFPANWIRMLPSDAPLSSMAAWQRLLDRLTAADWPDGHDHTATLRNIVTKLGQGFDVAAETGEAMLNGRALTIWRKALLAGPAASLDATLDNLKQDDGLEACTCVAWMPASAIAASPRRFVRLLGMNSSRWPRSISEDRLISDHIIPTAELDPLPVGAADRRDFETILATTERKVVLCRSRRDSEGRLLGRSPLLYGQPEETYLRRNLVPDHAMSETDRLLARPAEFQATPQSIAAACCWVDWHRRDITAHDGLVRADHPLLLAMLERTQSASSLRRLLRNPLGHVWLYAMGWRAPESTDEPLVLDPLGVGNLVHAVLDGALQALEADGGLARADPARITMAVRSATTTVAENWERERAVPPPLIWQRTLDEAQLLANRALTYGEMSAGDTRSYGEVPFGGAEPKTDAQPPWDVSTIVEIPGTGFRIAGYIDRLDVSTASCQALVCDYKTGKPPKENIVLNGGKELQRCLYAFAAKALLGPDIAIRASLLYLREPVDLLLDDPETTLTKMSGYLQSARASLAAGNSLAGPDAADTYDDLAFALPANAAATYCKRKSSAAAELFGDATQIWDAN